MQNHGIFLIRSIIVFAINFSCCRISFHRLSFSLFFFSLCFLASIDTVFLSIVFHFNCFSIAHLFPMLLSVSLSAIIYIIRPHRQRFFSLIGLNENNESECEQKKKKKKHFAQKARLKCQSTFIT